MKITKLIILQKNITQGKWRVLPTNDVGRKDGYLLAAIRFLGGDNATGKANAQAIACVPQFLAELIKLREFAEFVAESNAGNLEQMARTALEDT